MPPRTVTKVDEKSRSRLDASMSLRFAVFLWAACLLSATGAGQAATPNDDPGDHAPSHSAVITNDTIKLGVRDEGHLNMADAGIASKYDGTTDVGLRLIFPDGTESEATAPGCLCEGWGASAGDVSGWANADLEPPTAPTITPISFTSTASTAESVVEIGNAEVGGVLRVTHDFHPSPKTRFLYEVTVTLENISEGDITDLRYRRVMDWDIGPTTFVEFVTIDSGTAVDLTTTSDNGFDTPDPLSPATSINFFGDAVDNGPTDHGALFHFEFADVSADTPLASGESKVFNIYYGAAFSEPAAEAALAAVGAEAFSFGQPNIAPPADHGEPNTFIFAFSGVGGAPIFGGIHGTEDWGEAFDIWTYDVYGGEAQRKIGFLAARSAGVHILDVTDPESIVLLGIYAPLMCEDGTECHVDEVTFVEEENAIHASLGGCGVHIVSVADARNPDDLEPQSFEPQLLEVYDSHETDPQSWVEAVAVHDGLAYVADYDALRIFDVSGYDGDPLTADIGPALGTLEIDADDGGPVGNVVIYDDGELLLALVATGDGMRVVDVADPSSPAVLGAYQHSTDLGPYAITQDIALDMEDPSDPKALLPAWVGGLSVVGVIDEAEPELVEIDTLETDVAYYTAVAYQGKIYATEGTAGLRVLELYDDDDGPELVPVEGEDPIEVGNPGEDWAWDVVVADCVAYVTFGNLDSGAGGLQVTPLEQCGDILIAGDTGGAADDDLDGVADSEDNCLDSPNADQTDSDLDGFGNACDADYDGDSAVDAADLIIFSAAWGALAADDRYDARADHDADGDIDAADFMILSQRWGDPPGPSGLTCAGTVPCP